MSKRLVFSIEGDCERKLDQPGVFFIVNLCSVTFGLMMFLRLSWFLKSFLCVSSVWSRMMRRKLSIRLMVSVCGELMNFMPVRRVTL